MNEEATQLLHEIRDLLEQAAEREIPYMEEARRTLKFNRIVQRLALVLVVVVLVLFAAGAAMMAWKISELR
jgi:hypothetical protein